MFFNTIFKNTSTITEKQLSCIFLLYNTKLKTSKLIFLNFFDP